MEANAAADDATQAVARAQSEAALVAAMGNAARAQANASRAQSIAVSAEAGFLTGEPDHTPSAAANGASALPPWPALPPMPEVDRCVPVLPDDIRRKLQLLLALKFRLSLAAAADVEAFPARHATSATPPPAASTGSAGSASAPGPASLAQHGASLAQHGASLAAPLGSDRSAGSQDGDVCFICFSGPRDAVLLECGHGGLCFGCATRCMQMRFQECPICRQPISQIVQLELTERRGERAKRSTDGVVLSTIAQAGQLTQLDSVSEEDEEAPDVDALQSTRATANEPVRLLDA